MKKIIKRILKVLKHLLPVTWYRKLSQRQKLYVMTGVCGLFLIIIPSAIYTLTNAKKAEAAWYSESWDYRKKLTLNNSAQSSNLTNFPVMIKLTSSNFPFDQTNNDGSDIRFTDSDGTTLLEYEIEEYNKASGSATLWVKVPQVDASSSTDNIFIYWGNSSATDAQDKDNVWESNYKGVYHLNENSGSLFTLSDSSGNTNNLTTKETTSKSYQSTGKIGGSTSSPKWPNDIANQSTGYSELYPSMQLDTNNYPVIAYQDATNVDLLLMHCNDRECKGNDETIINLDSSGSTGYYPSLQLDSNGYPVITYYDSSAGDLNFIHCNDANCSGGDETITAVDSANTTGQFPTMVLDASGKPVIAYYDTSATDVQLIHCDDVNCLGTETAQTIDSSTGTMGNYNHSISLVLDASGYPVVSYFDATNTDLKLTHCNDINCSGGDETSVFVQTSSDNVGRESSIQLDTSGYPMITYMNYTTYNLMYVHCSDVNCSSTPTPVSLSNAYPYYPAMLKDGNGNPLIASSVYGAYPTLISCADTNCAIKYSSYLSLYNTQGNGYPSMDLDSDGYPVVAYYARSRTNVVYEVNIYTTNTRIKQNYDSDFNFGTSSFTTSLWFKTATLSANQVLLSRYDSDQGYKIWLDYGGHPCFGIDDDSTWNPDDSACTNNSSISTNVDNGQGGDIYETSVQLDTNGYPVIAYFDNSGYDLEIVHCNDANCSGGNESKYQVDTTGDVGRTPALKLDANGFPVIAYHDNTNQDLKIVHCGDASCSTGNSINTLDSTGDVGDWPALDLDTLGYPVIGYYDTTNTAVKLIHCNDVSCSGGDESTVTVDNTEDDRPYYSHEWMELDSNGYPAMAYMNATAGDVKVAHCNDANCSGGNESITSPVTTYYTGYYTSLKLDSNGYPVVAYYVGDNITLNVLKCNDVNCAGSNETISTISTDKDIGVYYLDLELDDNDIPKILSYSQSSWTNVLTVCNNEYCNNGSTISYFRLNPYSYYQSSMVLDSNGYPVITARKNGDLVLFHLDNGTSYSNTNAYDDSQWHHLVAVKNGTSSIRLYIDGVEVASDVSITNGTLTSDSAELHMGENLIALGSYKYWIDTFGGQIDEMQIDNTARSADWIKAQYLSEANNFVNFESSQAKHSLTATDNSINIKDGLVGYWKFDEGYGTTVKDSGPNKINGTAFVGTPAWTNDGKFGKALHFDGQDAAGDYVKIPYSSSLNIFSGTTWAVSMWVKPITGGVSAYTVLNGTSHKPRLVVNTTTASIEGFVGGNFTSILGASGITVNQWNHVVFMGDGTNNKIYINGKQKGSTAYQQLDSPPGEFHIGASGWGSENFQGDIDEVKFYNTSLTDEQMKLDYNQGKSIALGSFSDTSRLAGGSIASNSASAVYCIPGDTTSCTPPAGEWNFEEKSGIYANDASGNLNRGTLGGDGVGTDLPAWTSGKFGAALLFDGTNDYVDVPQNASINSANAVTVEAWINARSTSTLQYIANHGNANGNKRWRFDIDSNVLYFLVSADCSAHNYSASKAFTSTNEWVHVAATYENGSPTKVYINGIVGSNGSTGGTICSTGTESLTIGLRGTSTSPFNGKIDQVRVFSYARTPSQIAWDYNQGKPVGHWKFDECQGATANDSSGNRKNATLVPNGGKAVGTCNTADTMWGDGAIGKYNYSVSFDGTNYAQINSFPVASANQVSVAAWYKPNGGSDPRIISRGWCSNHGWLMHKGYGFGVNKGAGCTDQTWATFGTLTNDQWYFLVGIYDGTRVISYVNGVYKGQNNSVGTDLTLNNYGISMMTNDIGQLDDMRIYNYALTSTQVKNIMNQGSAVRWGPLNGAPQ